MRAGWKALCFGAAATLAGCDLPPPRDYMAEDSARCAAIGFEPGDDAMAQCMQTLAMERQAVADREAWRERARPAYAPYAYDDWRHDDRKRDKNRDDRREKPKPGKKTDKKPEKPKPQKPATAKPKPDPKPDPGPVVAKPDAKPPEKPRKPLPPCLGIGADPACGGTSDG